MFKPFLVVLLREITDNILNCWLVDLKSRSSVKEKKENMCKSIEEF